MKLLVVGDMHGVPSEYGDLSNLCDLIVKTKEEQKVDLTLLTGDLHHYHDQVLSRSIYFYKNFFDRFKKDELASLTGNHDLNAESGDPKIHALLAHEDDLVVIDKPYVNSGILFMPYRHDKELFIKECKEAADKTNTVIGHQSFNGAKFDNGMYDPHGIDLDYIRQNNLIQGHIHAPQQFANVHYVGAPRWRTRSDANYDRAIWLFEFDHDGKILTKMPISTNDVCRRILHFIDTEENPFDESLFNQKDEFRVDIKGTASYIEKRTKQLQRPGIQIKPIKVDSTKIIVRESDGILPAFTKYLNQYKPKYATPLEKLHNLSRERLKL